MNISIKHLYRIVLIVLTTFTITAQAQNADPASSENAPASEENAIETPTEISTETSIETPIDTANDPVKPDTEADPEEASQDRVFRPSEDISEDLVIAFPVDI